jgi:5'-methylthioadenosine phosphorylase
VIYDAAKQTGSTIHDKGTMVVIDGPQFSTKAESKMFRDWGMDIIGMTALPEARLAREAEICYATVAMVTDYDVWHPDHDTVTVEMVVSNLIRNAENGKKIVEYAVPRIPPTRTKCPCHNALANAIITSSELIPQQRKDELKLIIGGYIK